MMTAPEQSKVVAPIGACDCHMHVFDPRFPLSNPAAAAPPPDATAAVYLEMRRHLGLTRAVVVQPNGYRFDNACTLDAMEAFGAGTRGIVIVPPSITDAELGRLHALGVRGVRYFLLPGGALGIDTLPTMAARIAPLGWNINLQLDGGELPQHKSLLSRLPCKLVIDHNGKFLAPVTIDHFAFRTLQGLLDRGHCWVKLSAPYETSRAGPPHYQDVGALARAMVSAYPDRCLWASNWPHPNQRAIPSTAAMLDLLLEWAPGEAVRRRILVDNPAVVYGFAAR
jgi:D-galactarolactone isomerase